MCNLFNSNQDPTTIAFNSLPKDRYSISSSSWHDWGMLLPWGDPFKIFLTRGAQVKNSGPTPMVINQIWTRLNIGPQLRFSLAF